VSERYGNNEVPVDAILVGHAAAFAVVSPQLRASIEVKAGVEPGETLDLEYILHVDGFAVGPRISALTVVGLPRSAASQLIGQILATCKTAEERDSLMDEAYAFEEMIRADNLPNTAELSFHEDDGRG